jgi:Amt family ammonium transporter
MITLSKKLFTVRGALLAASLAFAAALPAASQDTAAVAVETLASVAAAPAADSALLARIDALEAAASGVDTGSNAFLMICAALVLFMTLPGLALFYGGLVRSKNILSVLAQCMGIAGVVAVLWWAFGYSLAFSEGSPFIGGLSMAFLNGVDGEASGKISHSVFAMFQLMFAIITPALIVGAIAERMKYSAVLLFVILWMIVVYFPMAHMVWGPGGFLNGFNAEAGIKALDFAGGTVVHMTSGWSALVLCIILGKRVGFGTKNFAPHSLTLTMVGTGILWVGWYGFNAGSALAADGIAAQAFMTTTLAAAIAGLTWALIDWIRIGKPTVLGFCSGIVGGLVVITPAAGFVTANGSVIIGVLAGIIPYFAVTYLKKWFKYDDALDTFGIHGVGGTLGAILTGVLATSAVNPGIEGLTDGLVIEQIKAVMFTAVLSIVATVIIAYIVKMIVGLRPTKDDEQIGLDMADHGEAGYHHEEN